MNKVLVITYYWPPAGGPGVQRWLKFITYLRDFGVEPLLYIPENPHYPVEDPSLLNEVPQDIRTFRRKITEPMKWAGWGLKNDVKRISSGVISDKRPSLLERVLLWIRGNLFIPDARVLWVKPSVAFLSEVLREERIHTIITTGPPHSVHLIGQALKEQYGVRWVADFRDPWTSIGYHKKLRLGRAAKKRHQELEKKVLTNADKILVTSRTTAAAFATISSKPIVVITNGFEAKWYPPTACTLDTEFTLSHIGSLLSGRNPLSLWQALKELLVENTAFREHFRLRLVGVVSPDVRESIGQYGLEPFLELLPYVPHSEAVAYQRSSQLLLLVEIDSEETRGILPGKLFEYLASRRPIIAIGPKDWEAGAIVRDSGAGAVFDYHSVKKLKETLLLWFQQYRDGMLGSTTGDIEKYSRRELTRKLAEELVWE